MSFKKQCKLQMVQDLPANFKEFLRPANLKASMHECRESVKNVSCEIAELHKRVAVFERQNEDLRTVKDELVKTKAQLQAFVGTKLHVSQLGLIAFMIEKIGALIKTLKLRASWVFSSVSNLFRKISVPPPPKSCIDKNTVSQ